MGMIKLGDDFIDDSGTILRKTARKLRYPEYKSFIGHSVGFYKNLKEEGLEFDVSNEIGNEGSKEMYRKNGIEMKWAYVKTSGEHKKNNGRIKIYGDSLLAYLSIEKGKAAYITIPQPKFAAKIREHKEMPLYKDITKLFGWK